MQGQTTAQTQTQDVIFYIDLSEYNEIRLIGREWWEQVKRKNEARLEWIPANEIIIIKKADKDSVEEKEEIIYSDWGIPLEKYVYKIIQTTKRYIVFYDLDDAVNLNVDSAKIVDELQKDAETIEVPLTINEDGIHEVDESNFADNLVKYFTKKYGNVCNIFNDDCELKEEVKEKLSEADREIYDFIYNHLCDIYDYECDS